MSKIWSVAIWSVFTVGGLAACLASAFYVFQDWHALNVYYARFDKLVMSDASMRSLFIAEAQQNAFRINCFADGLGVLLGAILAALGIQNLSARTRVKTVSQIHLPALRSCSDYD